MLRHHLDLLAIDLPGDHEDHIDLDIDDTDELEDDGDSADDAGRLHGLGHSKDHRPHRLQVVVGIAVTRGGMPVRLWVWPGSNQDQTVVGQAKDDLAGWKLNRVVWIGDSAFNSADNRKVWRRGRSGFILAEKIRFPRPTSSPRAAAEAATPESTSTSSQRSPSATASARSG